MYYINDKKLACFVDCLFRNEDMSVSKKVNYLLRKYDLFIQNYDLVKENV